jgi:TM2 domain-containing membrane protein YozV
MARPNEISFNSLKPSGRTVVKMYCRDCGKEVGESQSYCDKCGSRCGGDGEGKKKVHTVQIRDKSTGVAAVLSVLWAGLGQVYVGRIGRGLLFMILYPVLIVSVLIVFIVLFGFWPGIVIGSILSLSFWIWNIYDAYGLANQYNDALTSTGKRPW